MSDSMLSEIDHVAIAVFDLEAAIAWYQEVFGATVAHREVVESDGVEEALLAVADSYVQLLTPVRDDSTVAKFLANKGEGLHHVGYRVADCAVALQAVKDSGGRVIDEAPRPGSRGAGADGAAARSISAWRRSEARRRHCRAWYSRRRQAPSSARRLRSRWLHVGGRHSADRRRCD